MKRLAVDLAAVAERSNLTLALWKAARGRRRQPAVRRWMADADRRLDALAKAIRAGHAPAQQLRSFVIHDPKRRSISAPCFADRVLHHAILNLTEERFDAALVPSSHACRPGKGVHAGVLAVQQALRCWPWYVQVDVASYFASIDHTLLLEHLRRRFKGQAFLALLERIVRGARIPAGAAAPGCGLPIGALTSQHFANAYLDAADRWLLAQAAVCAHVRYMDDIVWCCRSAEAAAAVLARFEPWLLAERALRLKPSAGPQPSAQGISWCGFHIHRHVVWPGPRKRRRFVAGVQRLRRAELHGDASPAQLQRAHDGLLATLAGTSSLRWRQGLWQAAPVAAWEA